MPMSKRDFLELIVDLILIIAPIVPNGFSRKGGIGIKYGNVVSTP
jgi:hypothetical protein